MIDFISCSVSDVHSGLFGAITSSIEEEMMDSHADTVICHSTYHINLFRLQFNDILIMCQLKTA